FLAVLVRDVRFSVGGLLLLCGLYFGPQTLKHGASIDYEEGLLIDLSLCFAIAASYLVYPSLTESAKRRAALAIAAVALAVAMYFAKTTALATLVVILAMVISSRLITWHWKLTAAVIAVAPFALWVAHTTHDSGAVHFSSSWNGENLFRGN